MKSVLTMFGIILLIPGFVYPQDIGQYLILEDIGSYKRVTRGGRAEIFWRGRVILLWIIGISRMG